MTVELDAGNIPGDGLGKQPGIPFFAESWWPGQNRSHLASRPDRDRESGRGQWIQYFFNENQEKIFRETGIALARFRHLGQHQNS
ncbi:MAG: hypothetical protein FD153_2027, partial [Rhodospirillaceae bacterium]